MRSQHQVTRVTASSWTGEGRVDMNEGWDSVRCSECVYSFIGGETVKEVSCSLMEPFHLCPQILFEKNGSWK